MQEASHERPSAIERILILHIYVRFKAMFCMYTSVTFISEKAKFCWYAVDLSGPKSKPSER